MSLISWAFKRGSITEQTVQSESPCQTITPASGHLFGRPLGDVIKDNTLPSSIVVCIENLYCITFITLSQGEVLMEAALYAKIVILCK